MQVVNFHGGAVKNAVLAVFLRRYAAAATQNVGQRQLVIGQHQLDRAHAVAQHIVQLGQKLRQAAASLGARQQNVRVKRNGVRHIAFVVDHQLGDALAVKTAQNLIGHGQLLGGLGIAPGANIGKEYAVFEAVHGSAPDIAGQNKANPTAEIMSEAMMLDHLGELEIAERIRRGVRAVYADGSVLTGDIRKATGSSAPAASCTEFTEALIAAIKAQA